MEFGLYYHCVHRKKVKKQVFFLVHDYSLGPEFQLFLKLLSSKKNDITIGEDG